MSIVKVNLANKEKVEFKYLCSSPESVRAGRGDMQKALHDYVMRCIKTGKLL